MAQEQQEFSVPRRSKQAKSLYTQPLLAVVLPLIGAAMAIFLAGKAEQGNLGVFLVCAGLALVVFPPKAQLGRSVLFAAAIFLLCSAASLLPAHLFHVPVWRQSLASVPDLPLPETVSATPWQTGFWLAVLTVTTLVGLFILTQPLRSQRLLWLAVGAIALCGIYSGLSIFAKISGWVYPFTGDATFGFFPNRNHTATLLITGCVLSMGVMTVLFREHRWLTGDLVVVCLALCAVGLLFFSESRGGVLFLLVGLGVWVAGLGRRHLSQSLILTVALVVLVAGGLFLSLKSKARDRFLRSIPKEDAAQHATGSKDNTGAHAPGSRWSGEITTDDRLRIYRDTLGIIRDAPVTGLGLGAFSQVFAPYRQNSVNVNLVLHPESDWLMVAAETGLPALGCLAILGFFVLRSRYLDRQHPYWPLRWSFVAASLAAMLHGLVDVPIHRASLGWWILLLATLASQPGRDLPAAPASNRLERGWMIRGVFILGGLLALELGERLIRAQWFGGPALPPFAAKQAQAVILQTFERGNNAAALEQARQAVQTFPLSSPLYYQLGVLALRFEGTDAEVDRAFRIQRLLNPFPTSIPREQGRAWLPLDPARTTFLFVDALERQQRLLKSGDSTYPADSFWRELVGETAAVPPAQQLLWEPSKRLGPVFMLSWLEGVVPEVAKEWLPNLAADFSFLQQMDAGERKRFLLAWQSKGDRTALQTFVKNQALGWPEARPFQSPPP